MIPLPILKDTLEGLKAISGADMGLMDRAGNMIAATGDFNATDAAAALADPTTDTWKADGYYFCNINDEEQPPTILWVEDDGHSGDVVARMAAFQIEKLLIAYKERSDPDSFMKSLLLDGLLLVDIYKRAKKMQIEAAAKRVVMVAQSDAASHAPEYADGIIRGAIHDENILAAIRTHLGGDGRDYVTTLEENSVVIIKEINDGDGADEAEAAARDIAACLGRQGFSGIILSYGTVIGDLKDLGRSYKEAKIAMEVGKIFFDDERIIAYNQLGIARLIHQLPIPLCRLFIREVFPGKGPEDLDDDMLETIAYFFANSLNISEAARQLYIHRNTLVYRLDKLERLTGHDLRNFEAAITFRLAVMVVKYMHYMEKFDY